MSNYDHKFIFTIPPELIDIGRSIARALDSDVGGYNSYYPVIDGETIVAYKTDTPCTEDFYTKALMMVENPEILQAVVAQNYAERWSELTPPTLEECQAFCAGIQLPVVEPVVPE